MHMLARKRVLTAINRLSFKKILHVIKTRGPAVVHELTNFSLSEFKLVWKDLQFSVSQEWNVGSGRKCEVSGRDMLFMTLTSMKHCGSWDVVSVVFKEKSPMFLAAIHPTLRAKYIDTVLDKYSMQHLHTSGHRFNNFPSALYAVDVTFQRTNTPAGSFNEKKRFYSKKHGQYGLKVEASVLPNDLTINVATAVSGSVADITICESNLDFHQDKLKKIGKTTTCWTTAQCKKSILGRGLCLLTKATKAFTANCDHSDEATS
ncbi:hypothetical protein DYB31_013581, partial [Aphanomyces astaci]